MDNYIIERRARVRIAWFKRYEEIGNISQVCKGSLVPVRKTVIFRLSSSLIFPTLLSYFKKLGYPILGGILAQFIAKYYCLHGS